ncbi:hypothetical protein [Plebeiibacterium marinum]|uniref:Globin n=1 Tax=Plebeiibacterium marinum TaxID=2992111 RepID=A0AAE3SJH8_9BACT|nr:hypothetical protein [Plebeiobacterium marinum]MCW3805760.1 hypothetical protein [Plebeiobacterium marinum]
MYKTESFTITKLPFGERRKNFKPDLKLFEYLKEDGIRKMVSDHYDLLVKSEIKDIFPDSDQLLEGAKKRSADFFIQRFGGPEYYKMTRGNPMLADRHLPFKITPKARIVWLKCYREVICNLTEVPFEILLSFWKWLDEFSNWMVNEDDEPVYKMNFSL